MGMLTIGIPKEVKPNEKRVSLTPPGVQTLVGRRIRVFVEKGAGEQAGFPDEAYRSAGAEILPIAADIWCQSGLVKKVKEPVSSEFSSFRKNQILFCYLHLASKEQCELLRALIQSGVTAIGYETIEIQGYAPLLKPMSIVAGKLAAYFSGIYKNLAEVSEGKVHLSASVQAITKQIIDRFPDVPAGFPPGKVVVIGGGQAGLAAAEMAAEMRGQVTVLETNPHRRQYLTVYAKDYHLPILIQDAGKDYTEILYDADVIITCVHKVGQRAPEVISRSMLEEVSRGNRKVIVDISIDQGGNIAEARPTTYSDPLYLDSFGNIRFGVTNMPSVCPKQTSVMLDEATLDYTMALAEGLDKALGKYPELASGINVRNGELFNSSVAFAHKTTYRKL